MDKLTGFFKKAFSYPALLQKTHPLTTISVIATTILFTVYMLINAVTDFNGSDLAMDLFLCVCMSSAYFTTFALLWESVRPNWSTPVRSAVWAVSAVLSLIMGFVLLDTTGRRHYFFDNLISDIQERVGEVTLVLYVAGLVCIVLLLAVYFSYSHDIHQHFNSHVLNATSKVFFASIIYGIIQFGVLFLTIIASMLLFEDAFNYLPAILVLINGLFYVPAVIYSATHENEEANIFYQIIVRYISLVITLLGFVIIYIYIIKLVVTASVPSNSVYAILTALFIISMAIAYMCTAFENKGFLQKFAYNCPFVFAPFILMQCYTVIVRIGQYGLTPKRYFGIAFILFEITYIVYYAIARRGGEIAGRNILLIICTFIIVPVFLPGIGAKPLSTSLARHTLSSYLERSAEGAAISDREYMRANAAYEFLTDDDFGSRRLSKYFTGIDQDTLSDLRTKAKQAAASVREDSDGFDASDDENYAWFNTDLNELLEADDFDISGYDRLIHVRIRDDKDYVSDDKTCDPKNLNVYYYNNRDYDAKKSVPELPSVDLSDFTGRFFECFSRYDMDIDPVDDYNNACKGLCSIDINENVRLCITNTDITYDRTNKVPVRIDLEGYLFIKD